MKKSSLFLLITTLIATALMGCSGEEKLDPKDSMADQIKIAEEANKKEPAGKSSKGRMQSIQDAPGAPAAPTK